MRSLPRLLADSALISVVLRELNVWGVLFGGWGGGKLLKTGKKGVGGSYEFLGTSLLVGLETCAFVPF